MSAAQAKDKPPFVVDGRRVVALESPGLAPPAPAFDGHGDAEIGSELDCPTLRENFDEAAVNALMGRLVKSYAGGSSTTSLFMQMNQEGVGMSLLHAWFGANAQVFSHSHPCFGDCLYFVVAGEARMGAKRLKAGSVLFIPKGMSYRVVAGPVGLEMLEFRVGGRDSSQPNIRVTETSLEAVEAIIANNERNKAAWRQPARIGDLAQLQFEFDVATD